MDSTWEALGPSASPDIKLEASPIDSLLSDPSGIYPSLFAGSTVASSGAATPTDTGVVSMSPLSAAGIASGLAAKNLSLSAIASLSEPNDADLSIILPEISADEAEADADVLTPDKKQTKKRKSWGQVLPEPKTNLPPRYAQIVLNAPFQSASTMC